MSKILEVKLKFVGKEYEDYVKTMTLCEGINMMTIPPAVPVDRVIVSVYDSKEATEEIRKAQQLQVAKELETEMKIKSLEDQILLLQIDKSKLTTKTLEQERELILMRRVVKSFSMGKS